jgi:hypothetical protein
VRRSKIKPIRTVAIGSTKAHPLALVRTTPNADGAADDRSAVENRNLPCLAGGERHLAL